MKGVREICKIFNFIFLMILITSSVMSIPSVVSITGSLKDSQGNPISGNFATELKFYATENGTTVLDTVTTTTQVTSGVFNITLTPPDSIMMVDDIWYSLAIDSNFSGLDSSDLFANRFCITSVPYALSTPALNYFNTANGCDSWYPADPDYYKKNDMCVIPFVSPPGGVEFNKMYIIYRLLDNGPIYISFGIYDENGYLLYNSGQKSVQANYPDARGYVMVNITGSLLPSTKYYVGFGHDNDVLNNLFVGCGSGSSAPNLGWLHNVVSYGQIPTYFNPASIDCDLTIIFVPVNITLIKD